MSAIGTALLAVLCTVFFSSAAFADPVQDTIALCAAGLSNDLGVKVSGLLSNSGGNISASLVSNLTGAFFADSSLGPQERLSAYNTYASCIEQIYSDVPTIPDDAKHNVKEVVMSVNWRSASWLSSYDWVGDYTVRYQNQGPIPVSCHLRVRGVLLKYPSRVEERIGEVNEYDFSVSPGDTWGTSDDVGAYGFNDEDHLISLEPEYSCWYKGLKPSL